MRTAFGLLMLCIPEEVGRHLSYSLVHAATNEMKAEGAYESTWILYRRSATYLSRCGDRLHSDRALRCHTFMQKATASALRTGAVLECGTNSGLRLSVWWRKAFGFQSRGSIARCMMRRLVRQVVFVRTLGFRSFAPEGLVLRRIFRRPSATSAHFTCRRPRQCCCLEIRGDGNTILQVHMDVAAAISPSANTFLVIPTDFINFLRKNLP